MQRKEHNTVLPSRNEEISWCSALLPSLGVIAALGTAMVSSMVSAVITNEIPNDVFNCLNTTQHTSFQTQACNENSNQVGGILACLVLALFVTKASYDYFWRTENNSSYPNLFPAKKSETSPPEVDEENPDMRYRAF